MSQLTKEDFEKEIRALRKDMATKKDLENFATKQDLENFKLHMDARFEDVATKDDLAALEIKFIKDVDAVVGVQVKETKNLKQRVERLESAVFPKHA